MNPFEALAYMKEGGKVVAQRTPPWIDNPQWIDWVYSLDGDSIVAHYHGTQVQDWTVASFMNWWLNFCYNNSTNQTDFIAYESKA